MLGRGLADWSKLAVVLREAGLQYLSDIIDEELLTVGVTPLNDVLPRRRMSSSRRK